MRRQLLALFLAFYAAVIAYGGDSKGNGGNGIVCRRPDQSIRYSELLDFWESRELRGIHRRLEGPRVPWEKSVDRALARLGRLDSPRASRFAQWADAFFAETILQPGVILVTIEDSFHLSFPKDCRVEQLAIQQTPLFPEDKRYLVSGDLWDALDEENRAGLILHEVILREAVSLGQTDSRSARYFNSIITSDFFESLSAEEYAKRLLLMGFPASPTQQTQENP